MQTKFKDIAQYYLGTGLEIRETRLIYPRSEKIVILNSEHIVINSRTYKIKPLLRSLDSLTKPITVKGYNDGKEFVPLAIIWETYLDMDKIHSQKILWSDILILFKFVEELPLWIVKLFLKWHFNLFNLEETEYIKID